MQIIQIVARLPPAVDGVGDYASLLAKQLRAAHNIRTVFVVCDPSWRNAAREMPPAPQSQGATRKAEDENSPPSSEPGQASSKSSERITGEGNREPEIEPSSSLIAQPSTTLYGFPFYQLKTQTAAELLRVLAQPAMPTTCLLQFVGYGYQNRGCPVWLLNGLSAWLGRQAAEGDQRAALGQSASGARRLVTMFHELYAFGPPWRSSFWTSPVQRWIAKSLAQASEHCFTNLNVNARTLAKLTSRKDRHFTVLPVFSNVGEPAQLPSWGERQPKMVVFGSAAWRRKAYQECKHDLEKACHHMGLNEIVDIGAPTNLQELPVRVSGRGILSAAETSREMLSARAGFFAYPINCLGKSGIFAAYAAHGLVPVTFEGNKMENGDGLVLGEHFLSAAGVSGMAGSRFDEVGRRVHQWYSAHTIESQANGFQRRLQNEP
jgi:hypothetical protein